MSLLLRWVLNAVALFSMAYLSPRIGMLRGFEVDISTAFLAVAVLAILNLTVRPILKLLTLPITCLTFGLFTLVINALMFQLTASLVPGFRVGGWLNAVFASIIYTILSTILNTLFNAKGEKD